MNIKQKDLGFSLIELALVLVIIALLIATITGGRNMLEQARLKTIISEMQDISGAFAAFKQTYNAVPGDMRRASVFFPNCASAAGAGNVNCNGNGDGYVSFNMGNTWNGDGTGDEPAKVFRHLNQAGIYEKGGSTQLTNSFTSFGSFPTKGYHAYSETLEDAGYVIATIDGGNTGGSTMPADSIYVSSGLYLEPPFDNYETGVFMMKADASGGTTTLAAFQLDQKVDDGQFLNGNAIGAATGKFRTTNDTSADSCIEASDSNIYRVDLYSTTCVPGLKLD